MMSRLRNYLKTISKPFLKKGLELYYSKPRKYSYKGINVMVDPSVFPPHLTLSTKILLDFISEMDLNNTSLLELGCGSGIISLHASKSGAAVTATDINEIALEQVREASSNNELIVEVMHSDLFDRLSGRSFDRIIINPPYYPKDPKNIKEKAWFCGKDFDYFEKLFEQLPSFLSIDNQTYIILSEDCDIQKISEIALKNKIELKEIHQVKKYGETNFIYRTNL